MNTIEHKKRAGPKTDTPNDTPTPLCLCRISLYQITSLNFEYDRMLIYTRYFCHKICNVVRCEGLVFIRLANIFVKCDKEQIQQILSGGALVIDKRQYVIFNEL